MVGFCLCLVGGLVFIVLVDVVLGVWFACMRWLLGYGCLRCLAMVCTWVIVGLFVFLGFDLILLVAVCVNSVGSW